MSRKTTSCLMNTLILLAGLLATSAGAAALAQCPDEAGWRLFPFAAEPGNVVPEDQTASNKSATPPELPAGAPSQDAPAVPLETAGPATETIPEGLVLRLAFEDTDAQSVRDQGPHHLLGTIHGGARQLPALRGSGLEFDGKSGWVMMDASPALDIRGDLTVEVLARVPREVLGEGLYMMVWRGDEQGGRDPYILSIAGGRLLFRRDFPKTFQVAWPLRDMDFEQYHVFAGVHRSYEQIIELWLDGKKVGQAPVSGNFKYNTSGMSTQIGTMDGGKGQFFLGVIDEVRIFNRPLLPEQLSAEAGTLLGTGSQ